MALRLKKIQLALAFMTVIWICCSGCGQNTADLSKEHGSSTSDSTISDTLPGQASDIAPVSDTASVSDTVPVSDPLPPPPYTLDRSDIPEEVDREVTVLSSGASVTYDQVLDDAQLQGDQGELIDLTAYRLTALQIRDLTDRCQDRELLWQLDVDGVTVDPFTAELDLSGHPLAARGVDLYEIFRILPNLTRADICKTGFTNEEYAALQDTFPEIRMIWELVLSHWKLRTDAVAFSTQQINYDHFMYDDEAKYMKYCTDMVALDLGHNRISDWSFLQYMPNLKILIAVDNRIEDLSWLQYTPKLVYLEFFVGRITDLSFLQYVPNLVDLNISYNPISDASYLYNLPKLERLWMEHTEIPYSEFEKLQEAYPDAEIVYYGEGSIDQGWRSHKRFYAMRDMYRKNYVHELFMDRTETEE